MSAAAGSAPGRPPLARNGAVSLRPARAIDVLISPADGATASESPSQIATRRLKANRLAQVAAAVFLLVVTGAMSAPVMERHWAGRTAAEQNLSGTVIASGKEVEVVDLRGMPSVGPGLRREYTLGADPLGRDVFMRVLQGGKVSLTIGLGAAVITVIIGLMFGTMAGYYKGRIDLVISRGFDIMLAFPSLILAIALSTALASSGGFWFIERGSIMLPMLIIGGVGGPYFGRIVRAQALSLSERDFVEAARALGATDRRIMWNEMVPHLTTTVITYFGLLVSAYIIAEAGLSFLGVGVLPPTPSWGNMIADGRIFYATAWWISFFPGLMIMLTVLSLNLVGEAVEEALDPKSLGGK